MSACSYIDVDDEISFKVQPAVPQPQDENDYNSCNTNVPFSCDNGNGSVVKPATSALKEHDADAGAALATPQTTKRPRRNSDVQEALQEVAFRLDDAEPPTVVKPRVQNKRMSVGFGLTMRNACQDDFYAPKYSEAELETMVEERCAELQREHDKQLCVMRNDLMNAEARADTLDQELQVKAGENQQILLDLATQLEDLEKKAEETTNENALLKAQVAALAKQLHHYETEGQAETAELRASLEAEKARHKQELQQQVERHTGQIAELIAQRDEQLQQLRTDNQRVATALQCQIEMLTKDLNDKATQLKHLTEAKDLAIQTMQQNHAAELEQTKLRVKESFRKKFEKGNQEYHALQQQHEASLQQIQTLQQRVATLEESEKLAQATVGQLKEATQRVEAQLTQESTRCATLNQELSSLRNELQKAQADLTNVRTELQETAKERDAQMFAVARLVTGKEANEGELETLRTEADNLRAQNAQLTSMNEQLLEMLEKYYAEQENTEGADVAAEPEQGVEDASTF